MKPMHISELDLIFLSYDEENADRHFANLIAMAPWAQRVHGVKGFDAAHKAAAELAKTEMFITVDGDNLVDQEFFNWTLTVPEHWNNCVFSWNARNILNNLEYGNGGLKIWPRQYVLDMRTHEASTDPRSKVDFCWEGNYVQMARSYSTTHPNGSPYQAWRAGFREGVKMSLNAGVPFQAERWLKDAYETNISRVVTWATVGADSPNGEEAMRGAIEGIYAVFCEPGFDYTMISDLDALRNHWSMNHPEPDAYTVRINMCDRIHGETGLRLDPLNRHQSFLFKKYLKPFSVQHKLNPLTTEREIA